MNIKVDEHFVQFFLRSLLALTKILLVSTSMARCNRQINYLFLMMHEAMSFFNFQFKILVKCSVSL
jgi:hypothetical protein